MWSSATKTHQQMSRIGGSSLHSTTPYGWKGKGGNEPSRYGVAIGRSSRCGNCGSDRCLPFVEGRDRSYSLGSVRASRRAHEHRPARRLCDRSRRRVLVGRVCGHRQVDRRTGPGSTAFPGLRLDGDRARRRGPADQRPIPVDRGHQRLAELARHVADGASQFSPRATDEAPSPQRLFGVAWAG